MGSLRQRKTVSNMLSVSDDLGQCFYEPVDAVVAALYHVRGHNR